MRHEDWLGWAQEWLEARHPSALGTVSAGHGETIALHHAVAQVVPIVALHTVLSCISSALESPINMYDMANTTAYNRKLLDHGNEQLC